MKKLLVLKRSVIVMILMTVLSMFLVQNIMLEASTITKPYISDNFDKGLDDTKWQVVNDDGGIEFAKQGGTLRYDILAGGEQAIVTTDKLNEGEGVTGYQVQFDLNYKTDDWGAWYAFAFNKKTVENGLDWGGSGYLMGRTSSLQVNNPADSSSTGQGIDPYAALTPEIPLIGLKNITFKFVYKNDSKTVDVYYDLAGPEADLSTLRVTYTFAGLSSSEGYHFAIVGSSGQFEIDNFIIDQLKGTEVVNVANETFETNDLPASISLPKQDEFSYGPAGTLRIENSSDNALVLSKTKFENNPDVYNTFKVKFDVLLETLTPNEMPGFIYGLETLETSHLEKGVTLVYFTKRVVDEKEVTYITATVSDGEKFVPVLDQKIEFDFTEFLTLELSFTTYGITTIIINNKTVGEFTGSKMIGHYGFKGSLNSTLEFDNFSSKENLSIDQSNSPDIENNFNTGYITEDEFEIWNFIDKKPGTENPLFNTTKNIHLSDGKLVFDVVSESSAIYTTHSYTDFELTFEVSNFGKPVTPMNEDGEIEGVEIPDTLYVAVGFGYETHDDNFWDVRTLIFQDRFGAGVVYGMNVGDNTSYKIPDELRPNKEENSDETFEFKFVVLNGVIKMWVRRLSDPIDIFDGKPLVEYKNQDTTGRIGISSSALGSFALDNFRLKKIDHKSKPEIEDKVDPETVKAPNIEVVNNSKLFFMTDELAPDFKTYFKVTDNKDGEITVTDNMINTNGFDITKPGQYNIEITVKDSDNNTSTEKIVVSVSNNEVVPSSNSVLSTVLFTIGGVVIGASGLMLVLYLLKKRK